MTALVVILGAVFAAVIALIFALIKANDAYDKDMGIDSEDKEKDE